MAHPHFTERNVRHRLRSFLDTRPAKEWSGEPATPSAVLALLSERDGHVHLMFLRRADALRKHGGQVAFPGGKRDREDASLLATALREVEEEIAVPASAIDVLGRLDDMGTMTGFVITPFVGWIDASTPIVPNPEEVARVFYAPLARFTVAPAERRAQFFDRFGYTIDGEFLWGATAAITRALARMIAELPEDVGR
ncbi:MAG: CoA pyrophosphatase [Polyangiaceae bacterium]